MMKKFSILLVSIIFLNSCSSYYSSVSLEKISSQKKLTAEKFAQTLFKKCREKDYSEFKGFNISKQFEMFLVKDSLKKQCEKIEKKIWKHHGIEINFSTYSETPTRYYGCLKL